MIKSANVLRLLAAMNRDREHEQASSSSSAALLSLQPLSTHQLPVGTFRATAEHIGANPYIITHPHCATINCHYIWYDISSMEERYRLPDLCPSCKEPVKDRSGKDTFNWFPVRSIKDELEDLLAIAGVEELLEEQAERGRKPTDAPLAAGKKLFNHQSDGSKWLRWDLDDPTAVVARINLSEDGTNVFSDVSAKKKSTVTGITSISVVAWRSIRMICLLSLPFASGHSFLQKSSQSVLSPAPAPSGPGYSFLQSPVSVSPSRKFPCLAFASLGIFTSSPVKFNTIRVERRATTLIDVTPVTVCQLAHPPTRAI